MRTASTNSDHSAANGGVLGMRQIELPLGVDDSRARAPRKGHDERNVRAPRWALDCHQIERARVIANLTYEQLADVAHVDRATLSDMLNGRRRPTLGSVHAVIRALELDPAAVLLFK